MAGDEQSLFEVSAVYRILFGICSLWKANIIILIASNHMGTDGGFGVWGAISVLLMYFVQLRIATCCSKIL
jgi:hypothetical protein